MKKKHSMSGLVPVVAIVLTFAVSFVILFFPKQLVGLNIMLGISNSWRELLLVLVPSILIGGTLYWLFKRKNHRTIPNLILAAAWTIVLHVMLSSVKDDAITIVYILDQAYTKGALGGKFIELVLKDFSIGVFGTSLLTIANEAIRELWGAELLGSSEKSILAKFKRARRNLLFYCITPRSDYNQIYCHIFAFLVAFAISVITTVVLSAGDRNQLRISIILLLAA